MQKHTCKFTVGYNEQPDAVSACRGMHGKVVPDIKKRNTLVISVNYQVPRNHCFKCFTLVDTKVSHGHTARECPHVDPPPCEVCHEIHEGERCGWYVHHDTVLHDYDSITNRDRSNRAKARSQALTAAAYASVAGSQYGSQYAGSVADPRDLIDPRSLPHAQERYAPFVWTPRTAEQNHEKYGRPDMQEVRPPYDKRSPPHSQPGRQRHQPGDDGGDQQWETPFQDRRAAAPSQQRGWGRQQWEAPASPVRAPDSIPGLLRRNSPDNDPYASRQLRGVGGITITTGTWTHPPPAGE